LDPDFFTHSEETNPLIEKKNFGRYCELKIYQNCIHFKRKLGRGEYEEFQKWTLLLTDEIHFKEGEIEKKFSIKDIQEFLFVVNQTSWGKRSETVMDTESVIEHTTLYVLNKDQKFAQEFFNFTTYNTEVEMDNKTNGYYVAQSFLKYLSKKYHIPYSYKWGVDTAENTNIGLAIIGSLFVIIALIITFYMLSR